MDEFFSAFGPTTLVYLAIYLLAKFWLRPSTASRKKLIFTFCFWTGVAFFASLATCITVESLLRHETNQQCKYLVLEAWDNLEDDICLLNRLQGKIEIENDEPAHWESIRHNLQFIEQYTAVLVKDNEFQRSCPSGWMMVNTFQSNLEFVSASVNNSRITFKARISSLGTLISLLEGFSEKLAQIAVWYDTKSTAIGWSEPFDRSSSYQY